MTLGTMQEIPLSISSIFQHGRRIHPTSQIITYNGPDAEPTSTNFADVGDRSDQLAAALHRLGVSEGDRIGTFMWNNQRHMEAYLAIPSMGAVLHTLNIRLFPDQLRYVINHAEDKVIIVDASLAPLLAAVRDQIPTVEHIIVCGDGDTSALGATLDYEALIAAEDPGYEYPLVDERSAAAMCYTSGTTGNPKGVAYSHRSTYIHSMAATSSQMLRIDEHGRILLIVPQFHANAWGMPYAAWWVGCDLVLPQQHLQAEPIVDMIERLQPTMSGAVPTVLNDVLVNRPDADLSSLEYIICGGAAVPRSLMEGYDDVFGVEVIQAWGMTETSPLGAIARLPASRSEGDDPWQWRTRTGRVIPGVEVRICADDGTVLPWDDSAQGEIEIRGPWIAGSYYLDPTDEKFHDGWLRTGDVGTIDPTGYIQITDRAKDVIKSGGEWISSVDLENELMGHPDVLEAAVVGVPDDKWDERPLACVVPMAGAELDAAELQSFLVDRVAKWWLPERWAIIDTIPKTSVGKFSKKDLRQLYADGELPVADL